MIDLRILVFAGVLVALLSMSSAEGAEAVGNLSSLETEVLQEMNLARTQPKAYAAHLKELRRYFRGRSNRRSTSRSTRRSCAPAARRSGSMAGSRPA